VEPLVSVCITSYNYGRYLRDAIESALGQTYPHIEVVVSDNASTDATHEVLAGYSEDPRLRIFVNERNEGLCANHNLAIGRARGEYIVLLSADDVLFPQHVALLLERIRDPSDPVLVASGQGMELSEELEPLGPLLTLGNMPLAYSQRDEFGSLVYNYHHVFPARLINRSVYDRIGLFDERIITSIDIELCVRMEEADIPSAFVPAFVCGLRRHGSRRSVRSRSQMNELFNDKLCVVERALQTCNAWRIEGFERAILDVLKAEEDRFAERGREQLEPHLSDRLATVRGLLGERSALVPEWPAHKPELSVVLLCEGYLQLLHQTLSALARQRVARLELLVIQTSGCDVTPWLQRLPCAGSIRVIQARACANPADAFRNGMDLARGEYVTYLHEGQLFADDLYETVLAYARATAARILVVPKGSVHDELMHATPREPRAHQFAAPADRAAARTTGGPYALSQLTHRRGLFRCSQMSGTSFYDVMIACDESLFVQALSEQFQSVMFSVAGERG
jgi:glycosyltransferase involved in cell wall biosynthesis